MWIRRHAALELAKTMLGGVAFASAGLSAAGFDSRFLFFWEKPA
jgi:hypothetical protein